MAGVAAVVGTHTHVQTADECIFPSGTAFICDVGMCGPVESILGRSIEPIVKRFKTNMPCSFPIAKGAVNICGVIIQVDSFTAKALSIKRIKCLLFQGVTHLFFGFQELKSSFLF